MKCSIEGCGHESSARGWCKKHWQRWNRTGSTNDPVKKTAPRGSGWLGENGYRILYRPSHPNSAKNGHIAEHVLVMSEILGRPLFKGETVHHKNGSRSDNRPDNLELWVTHQPAGQRPEDLIAWAHEILDRYEDERIQNGLRNTSLG